MIVDALVHLGTSHFGYRLDAGAALAGMAAVGTDVAVAVPVHPKGADFTPANDAVTQAAAASQGRLVPLARVDPWDGDAAVAELRRAGVRLVGTPGPTWQHFVGPDGNVYEVVSAARGGPTDLGGDPTT